MTTYKPGTWNVICIVCGFKHKADDLVLRWDGALVCKKDYEPRHPSDFLRIAREGTPPTNISPEPADVFIDVPYV